MKHNKEFLLNENLSQLVDELDLPEAKYELAIKRYELIGEYLSDEKSPLSVYDPQIYSQGSFRLGTVVSPLTSDEYDIDLVCELQCESQIAQKELFELIGARLKENDNYKKILKAKRRCWRLEYANEFHMDILPAVPDKNDGSNSILIPDKKLEHWHSSNPKGYVEWFFSQMSPLRLELIKEARGEVEEVPFYKYKTPLQKAIQLLKRHRDIAFQEDEDDKPISIIISTLAAKAYQNEPNLYQAVLNIIDRMPQQFDIINGEAVVLNPVNQKENFADKWSEHPVRRTKFINWLNDLSISFKEILKYENKETYVQKMGGMFGSRIFSKIANEQKELIQEHFKIIKQSPIIISEPPKPWKY